MKDVRPEQTPKNAKVEKYTNEIDVENERTIIDRLFIKAYDFCQSRRRVELLAFTVLALMLYAMWKFIT